MRTDLDKAKVREQFYKIGKIVESAVNAKNAYRKRLAELELQKVSYTEEYTKELREKARADLLATYAPLHDDTKAQIEKLRNVLLELNSQLDLADPALRNALDIIKSVGPGLDSESVLKINAQFENQSALKLLQSAYKAAGVDYDGGLDRRIYNAESILQEAEKSAHAAFTQERGSINALAGSVAKLATFEGQEFEKTPDSTGIDEAIARGAGLPIA